jgi:hypothetical protein
VEHLLEVGGFQPDVTVVIRATMGHLPVDGVHQPMDVVGVFAKFWWEYCLGIKIVGQPEPN